MDSIVFRTTDSQRWGTGQGSDLTATQIDINFWVLYTMLLSLQDHTDTNAGIESITITGTQMFVNLTNHVQLGPFTLPQAQWNFRGPWNAGVQYNINDVFTQGGAVYLVIWPNTSVAPFSQFANDGNGHNWYAPLLAAPPNPLPFDGTRGQRLTFQNSPGDVIWTTDTRNIAVYLETPPEPLEEVLRYIVPEDMTFPVGLVLSQAGAQRSPTVEQVYEIYQNGANIGSINFMISPAYPTFTCPVEINFLPGDVISILAPSIPDMHMTNIAFTLVGLLP